MNTILVPIDFSEISKAAFQFALEYAAVTKSRIHAIHVIDLPIEQYRQEAQLKFKFWESTYNKKGVHTKFFIELGAVVSVVEQFIKEHVPSLIIMGTNGARGLKEVMFGSTVEKVIRNSAIPVWAVPRLVHVLDIKNVVVPTDLDLNQPAAVEQIKDLRTVFNSKFHLLFVNTAENHKLESEAMKEINTYKAHYKLSHASVNIRNAYNEADGIYSFAKEIHADAIAMPTHVRSGFSLWVLGSCTQDVVNHYKFPVFVVPFHDRK
jgi:nucleotide-binding universal stress UspA family protein